MATHIKPQKFINSNFKVNFHIFCSSLDICVSWFLSPVPALNEVILIPSHSCTNTMITNTYWRLIAYKPFGRSVKNTAETRKSFWKMAVEGYQEIQLHSGDSAIDIDAFIIVMGWASIRLTLWKRNSSGQLVMLPASNRGFPSCGAGASWGPTMMF